MILLCIKKDSNSCFGLLQLVVDGNERLDAGGGRGVEFGFFVVQCFCVRVALLCEGSQCSYLWDVKDNNNKIQGPKLLLDTSTGSGLLSCSINSAKFRRICKISGGMLGERKAVSRDLTSSSCCCSCNSLQHDT
jgi:hypothetical protein